MTYTWPDILTGLVRREGLEAEAAQWALNEILSGRASDVQLAALLVALRAKGETAEEIEGLSSAMLDNAVQVTLDREAVDVVGTGGDRANTVNVSTMAALVAAAAPDADFLLMVKPQFEIGKDRLGRGGVVRDPAHHVETVEKVARCALAEGLAIAAVQASPLPGPSGNIEYFIHMRKGHPTPIDPGTLTDHIRDAVRRGPAGGALHG